MMATEREVDDALNAVKFAAQIADQLLAKAGDDGVKLLAVHKHYPTGSAAWSVGFWFMAGAICSASLIVGITGVTLRFLAWLFA